MYKINFQLDHFKRWLLGAASMSTCDSDEYNIEWTPRKSRLYCHVNMNSLKMDREWLSMLEQKFNTLKLHTESSIIHTLHCWCNIALRTSDGSSEFFLFHKRKTQLQQFQLWNCGMDYCFKWLFPISKTINMIFLYREFHLNINISRKHESKCQNWLWEWRGNALQLW